VARIFEIVFKVAKTCRQQHQFQSNLDEKRIFGNTANKIEHNAFM
jgi:hypothetical protein